jgi:hypothetical protein
VTLPRTLLPALLTAALALLALAAPAGAARPIYADCADGSLDEDYSTGELREARRTIPTDVDEYTDCRDLLNAALDEAIAGGGDGSGGSVDGGDGAGSSGTGGSGGTAGGGSEPIEPLTAAEVVELEKALTSPPPVEVGGQSVVPGSANFQGDRVRQDIPAPLIVVLILLGVLGAALAVPALRTRVLHRLRRP